MGTRVQYPISFFFVSFLVGNLKKHFSEIDPVLVKMVERKVNMTHLQVKSG